MNPTIQHYLDQAIHHHTAGRLHEAEEIYRKILQLDSQQPDILNLLGIIAQQTGRHEIAVDCIRQAIHLGSNIPEAHDCLGNSLAALGKYDAAVSSYLQALALRPDNTNTHTNLGYALLSLGKINEARICFRRVLEQSPNTARAHTGLGLACHNEKSWLDAISLYQRALNLSPGDIPTLVHLGIALQELGRMDEAIVQFSNALRHTRDSNFQSFILIPPEQPQLTANLLGIACHQLHKLPEALSYYNQALSLQPNYPAALSNYGFALMAQGKPKEATEQFLKAIDLQPDFPEAHSNLGTAFQELGQYSKAEKCFREAVRLQPNYTCAWYNLGLALQSQSLYDEALVALRQAKQIDPNYPEAQLAEGLILLLIGDYKAGWALHEWRWLSAGFHPHGHTQPLWDGRDLTGRTLLLHCEQGFGDSIQFIRLIPLVKKFGPTIVVLCPEPLKRLFRTVNAINHLHTTVQTLPRCDFQAPLLSLPHILGITLSTVPTHIPYLYASPHCCAKFRLLANKYSGFKVGLAWRGNPNHKNDINRSIPPRFLSRLLNLKNCVFMGLQKEIHPGDLEVFAHQDNFIHWGNHLDDFADTAAAISQLDLVIAIDSAVIHLAGALGHRSWVLLPMVPDWRWGLHEHKNPWYHSIHCFRQTQTGDWEGVVDRVSRQLRLLTSNPAKP